MHRKEQVTFSSHRVIILKLGKNVWSQGGPHVDRKTPWFCHLTASSATFFHTNEGLRAGISSTKIGGSTPAMFCW